MAERRKTRNPRGLKAKSSANSQRTLFDLIYKSSHVEEQKEHVGDSDELNTTTSTESGKGDTSNTLSNIDDSDIVTVTSPRPPVSFTFSSATSLVIKQDKPERKPFPLFSRALAKTKSVTSDTDGVQMKGPDVYDLTGDDSLSEIDIVEDVSSSNLSQATSLSCPRSSPPPSDITPSSNQTPHIPSLSLASSDDELDSLPERDLARTQPTRIFVPSEKRSVYKKPPPTVSGGKVLDAPLPDQHSQHVRGPQSTFTKPKQYSKRSPRLKQTTAAGDISLKFLSSLIGAEKQGNSRRTFKSSRINSSTNSDRHLEPLTLCHGGLHPAIRRFLTVEPCQEPSSSQETWTARWRPRRAEEVLWNERPASYLRDWLVALGLRPEEKPSIESGSQASQSQSQSAKTGKKGKAKMTGSQERGVKRPRIVRTVTKTRKKRRLHSDDELDDFVVYDDESEGENFSGGGNQILDEVDVYGQPLTRTLGSQGHGHPMEDPTTSILGNQAGRSEPNFRHDFTDLLTNTILLSGPPGCGKTAAVYACAEELGYEVFEVYPGIGRRNGASLDSLIGDVGKNHLIQKSSNGPTASSSLGGVKTKDAFSTLFSQAKKRSHHDVIKHVGTEDHPIDIESENHGDDPCLTDEPLKPPMPQSPVSVQTNNDQAVLAQDFTAVRQSLVLLEEVDILFKEDSGFWPAVVEMIKECRRPVVMTCNDILLVPVADLPLQTVLTFQTCPSPEAISYLQGLCYAEACSVSREHLAQVYKASHSLGSVDNLDVPLNPRTELPVSDIRRTINQLQLLCSKGEHGITRDTYQVSRDINGETCFLPGISGIDGESCPDLIETPSAESLTDTGTLNENWTLVCRRTELTSYMDSHLHRVPLDTPEALSLNICEPSPDDELGHSILFKPSHVSDTRDSLSFYHEDEMIVLEATRLARGAREAWDTDPINTAAEPGIEPVWDELFRSRVAYQTQMVEALQFTVYPPAPLMPQPAVFLDYIPWVRYIVEVDDILERQAWDGIEKQRSGRLTRNSMKTKHAHARTIELSEEEQRILATTKLEGL